CSALACMACSDCHALVAMQRPDSRSTSSDRPTHPSTPISAGITSSRTWAIPSSIEGGWAWIVVARAYTIHPQGVGAAPPAAPPDSTPASYYGLVLGNPMAGIFGPWN